MLDISNVSWALAGGKNGHHEGNLDSHHLGFRPRNLNGKGSHVKYYFRLAYQQKFKCEPIFHSRLFVQERHPEIWNLAKGNIFSFCCSRLISTGPTFQERIEIVFQQIPKIIRQINRVTVAQWSCAGVVFGRSSIQSQRPTILTQVFPVLLLSHTRQMVGQYLDSPFPRRDPLMPKGHKYIQIQIDRWKV